MATPELQQYGQVQGGAGIPPPPTPAPLPPAPAPVLAPTGGPRIPEPQPSPISPFPSNQDLITNQALNAIFNPTPNTAFNAGSAGSLPSLPPIGGISVGNLSPISPIQVNPINTTGGSINPGQFNTLSGATASVPNLITPAQTQQAVQGLLNPASPFDVMSGGPIVNEINARTNALQEAYRNQQFLNLERGLETRRSGLAAEGVLSGSDVLRAENELIQGVTNDIAVLEAGMGLENTRYLGDLALRDIENRTNGLAQVLTQSMVQQGIQADIATSNADRISREVIAGQEIKLQANLANLQAQTQREIANLDAITRASIATADINARIQLGQLEAQTQAKIAQLNAQVQQNIAMLDNARALQLGTLQAQTNLALGQMGAGVDVLQLMQQDFQNQQANMLNVAGLPLDLLGGLAGPLSISSGSSSSK
jgi:hypothetical protein